MKKRYRLLISLFLIFLLVEVRSYGVAIFYDPFIKYFEGDYLTGSFPEFDMPKLFFNMGGRYMINSVISLAIIYTVFLKKEVLLFAIKFYVLAFFILSAFYFIHLKMGFSNGYLSPFYIRRILIHPILLLVLLPTFYYQKLKKR